MNEEDKKYSTAPIGSQQRSQDLIAAANTMINKTGTEQKDTQVQPTKVKRTYSSYKEDPRVFVDGQQQGVDVPVKSEEAVYRDMYSRARGELDALGQLEKDLLAEQNVINQKNERSTQAVSTLSGLAGSTEADIQQQKTTAVGQKANKQIQNEVNLQRQQLLSNLRKSATEEARNLRLEARQSEQDRIASRAARQQEAQTMLTNMSASGLDLDEIKASEPDSYNYLVKQYGSETALRGAYTLNTPQDQILDKRLEGGKYIIAKQNPFTGKINVETVDLGLPTGYSKTIDAGDRILAVPDNWDGDTSKLIPIDKGLTPTQQAEVGGGTQGAFTNDLDALIGRVPLIIPSENGKVAFNQAIFRARNDADKLQAVATVALKQAPSEIRNDFTKQAQAMNSIDKAINLIDSGTRTGILNNAAQYTFNVVGKDFDPKLAAIQAYITSAIQPYRSSITGAAWGDQEDQEYANLFGSTKYSPTELKDRLTRVKELMKDKSAIALSSQLQFTPDVVNFGGTQTGTVTNQSQGGRIMVGTDGKQYDASELSEEELRQAQADGYTLQ